MENREQVSSSQKQNVYRTRFAPSPSGLLHLGHIASAIYVWGIGRSLGAKICLRIEDHDRIRSRKIFEEEILRDLEWLGFIADEGITSVDQKSRFRQSDCYESYRGYLDQLIGMGLTYYCDCSRKSYQISGSPVGSESPYPGCCRNRGIDKVLGTGIRCKVESKTINFDDFFWGEQRQNPAQQCGDFLVQDRDNNWTYQFAVVADDIDQGINLVIRGEDILNSTGRQLFLRRALGSSLSIQWGHHPLILDDHSQQKLSKSLKSEPISVYRRDGSHPGWLLGEAAKKVGLVAESMRMKVADFYDVFSVDPRFRKT